MSWHSSLTYSSSAGPSPYGYGWDLPLGKIQRSGKHGVLSCSSARYRNDFVLVLPGGNVECTLNTADGICYPGVEESFVRIQYDTALNEWHAWDKGGLHYEFGRWPEARSPNDAGLFSGMASGCSYTHVWALTHITDPNNNSLTITYESVAGVSYPQRIAYGGNNTQGAVPAACLPWTSPGGRGRPGTRR